MLSRHSVKKYCVRPLPFQRLVVRQFEQVGECKSQFIKHFMKVNVDEQFADSGRITQPFFRRQLHAGEGVAEDPLKTAGAFIHRRIDDDRRVHHHIPDERDLVQHLIPVRIGKRFLFDDGGKAGTGGDLTVNVGVHAADVGVDIPERMPDDVHQLLGAGLKGAVRSAV